MTTFAHGVLTVRDDGTFTWKVFGPDEKIEDERLEQAAGPEPGDYEIMLAMLGGRGWELVQVNAAGSDWVFWFKRAND